MASKQKSRSPVGKRGSKLTSVTTTTKVTDLCNSEFENFLRYYNCCRMLHAECCEPIGRVSYKRIYLCYFCFR